MKGIGDSTRRSVSILGSTGSVGCSTVSLIDADPRAYDVRCLTGGSNAVLLAAQARRLRPGFVAIADELAYPELKRLLSGEPIEVAAGADAIVEAARRRADWVMAAIVGAAGLAPTLAAVERGATVALANKECLVSAGALLMDRVRRHGSTLLPVDSEHNAIFQVFDFERPETVERIILTASGGPFRTAGRDRMARATPAQAVAHPNWSMGAKISVDSATMMNKGLELIEASHLFPVPQERIEILVHPQSVVHSMVAYRDGSVLAQLGTPDMRTPIAVTLAWPTRIAIDGARLDLASIGSLTFEQPDVDRFPALALAREALRRGGRAPTVLNAANEIAVGAFLAGRIGFLDICRIVEETMALMPDGRMDDLEAVWEADCEARARADLLVGRPKAAAF